MKLYGKTALITGASKGIGLAIAKAFLREGATVAANFHPKQPLSKNDQDFFREFGKRGLLVEGDISSESSVEAMFKQLNAELGHIDIIVSNAGVAQRTPLLTSSMDDFDRIMAVNLRGTYLVGKHGIKSMQRSEKPASLINIASELAYAGRAFNSAYCASKAGVLGLTKSWALEFAPHIRVNAIAPGPINTDMCNPQKMTEEEYHQETSNPLGRLGTPEEVAATAVFLASDDSSFFTGQCLGPNGGAVLC